MPKKSAGLLLYRKAQKGPELLLVHPGGPFWVKRDAGAWSIPKGEYEGDEEPLACAMREFEEELGAPPPQGKILPLGELSQPSRKTIIAYAVEGDFDPQRLRSNTFEIEWPPKSGQLKSFPEVDKAAWFTIEESRTKIQSGQAPFIDRLLEALGLRSSIASQH